VAADRMLSLLMQEAMGPIAEEVKEALEVTSRSNQNLLTLVNTLLEVYRYEAGRKTLNFTPVALATLAQDVIEELQPLALDKGLTIELLHVPGEPATVDGDRMELRRVLTNLIGNAIKFTDHGSIKVQLSTKQVRSGYVNAGAKVVQIQVQDTGPGIAPEEQAILFESFVPGQHKRSGSGLGLHLSRCIMAVHSGTITVESEVGRGSIFTARMPACQAEYATIGSRQRVE
jgi:two-component system, sensor histidine kinase and response regulator